MLFPVSKHNTHTHTPIINYALKSEVAIAFCCIVAMLSSLKVPCKFICALFVLRLVKREILSQSNVKQ